jgi:hypothetical protein
LEAALGDRVLRGALAIAAFRGEPPTQTYYALKCGRIDAWKRGSIWYSTESRLARQIQNEQRYVPPPTAENGANGGEHDAEPAPPQERERRRRRRRRQRGRLPLREVNTDA